MSAGSGFEIDAAHVTRGHRPSVIDLRVSGKRFLESRRNRTVSTVHYEIRQEFHSNRSTRKYTYTPVPKFFFLSVVFVCVVGERVRKLSVGLGTFDGKENNSHFYRGKSYSGLLDDFGQRLLRETQIRMKYRNEARSFTFLCT